MRPSSAVCRSWHLDAPIRQMAVNRRGDVVAVACADGTVRLWPADDTADAPKIVALHIGTIGALRQDADAHAFLSSGAQGRVVILDPEVDYPTDLMQTEPMAHGYVAGSCEGVRACAWENRVYLFDPFGAPLREITRESRVTGVAFSPDGALLAIARQEGLEIVGGAAFERTCQRWGWPIEGGAEVNAEAESLVFWTPDGAIVAAGVQRALVAWRIGGGDPLVLSGLAQTPRTGGVVAARSHAATLVASGAAQVVATKLFDFSPCAALGPLGQRIVTCVAPHPVEPVIAAGYDDGMVAVIPLDGRRELLVLPPARPQQDAVCGLDWNAFGDCLFVARAEASLFLLTQKSIRAFATAG